MARIIPLLAAAGALGACGRIRFDDDPAHTGADARLDDAAPDDDAPTSLTSPIASWNFDDAGQTIADGDGQWNGVLGATASAESSDPTRESTPGRICSGTGLTFDGANDVVTIPSPSAANLSAFSISFSLYSTGPGGMSLPRIVTKEDGGQSDVIVHVRAIDDAIAINMFNTGNTLFATFANGIVIGQRANWVVTYDDAGDRRLHVFKNGLETTYLRQDRVTGTFRTTTNSWRIGNQATGIRGLSGTIDAVQIYDVVLSPSEIAALSAQCPP